MMIGIVNMKDMHITGKFKKRNQYEGNIPKTARADNR